MPGLVHVPVPAAGTASWLDTMPRRRNISQRSRRVRRWRSRHSTTSAMTSDGYCARLSVNEATRPVFRRGWWMCCVGLEQGASGRHYGRHQ